MRRCERFRPASRGATRQLRVSVGLPLGGKPLTSADWMVTRKLRVEFH